MKVFIDTNVLIDFIARREQFYQTAANLINLGIKGELKLYTTPLLTVIGPSNPVDWIVMDSRGQVS